jgi:pilus assembly protein Flp/PilA
MKNLVSRFMQDESGATAIEYALIAAIVSVGLITILGTLGDELEETFNSIATALESANTP